MTCKVFELVERGDNDPHFRYSYLLPGDNLIRITTNPAADADDVNISLWRNASTVMRKHNQASDAYEDDEPVLVFWLRPNPNDGIDSSAVYTVYNLHTRTESRLNAALLAKDVIRGKIPVRALIEAYISRGSPFARVIPLPFRKRLIALAYLGEC